VQEPPSHPAPRASGSSAVPGLPLILTAAVMTALADFLFYGAPTGWTLGAFAACVLLASAVLNPHLLAGQWGKAAFVLTLGLCAALFEYPSALAVCMTVTGLASLVTSSVVRFRGSAGRWARGLGMFAVEWAPRILVDAVRISAAATSVFTQRMVAPALASWIVPLGLSALFFALFYVANPVIASWVDALNWVTYPDVWLPPFGRMAFWIFTTLALWPFLRARLFRRDTQPETAAPVPVLNAKESDWLRSTLLPQGAMIKSLVLFNALFALQNGLDIEYLWRGAMLPEGMTFASYAHQSVYPLLLTALLAAAFVLIAFPPDLQEKPSRLIGGLLVLWVAQNVFLVASSMQRTALYIDEYSLTYLRVSALIWMGLIAAGLIWIVLRIALGRSSRWLINANVLTLGAVLYVCCFIDFGAIIANYNVRNCREINGTSAILDLDYLRYDIGVSSLPALRWLASEATRATPGSALADRGPGFAASADRLEADLHQKGQNWRAWTYRGYRLGQKLRSLAEPPLEPVSGWPVVRP